MNRQTNVLQRISFGFAALIIISLLATLIGFASWLYMNNRLQTQRDRQVQLATLTERVKGGFNIEIGTARAVLLERAFGNAQHTDVEAAAAPIDAAEAALQKILPDQASKEAYAAFETASTGFDAAQASVVSLAQTGDYRQAAQVAQRQLDPAGARVQRSLTALGAAIDKRMAADQHSLDNLAWIAGIAMALVTAAAVVAGITIAVRLRRSTGQTLAEVIGRLSTSTAELLAVTSQVAAGAVQTATAISEAATTVDEVRQTSLLSSQKATSVSDSAQNADQVAEAGRRAVSDTLEGIQRIQDQMSVVADSVVRLSEQTEAVSEIISTSNDLAEQSNLLSVNAAIEAAKASDQGKGFGVVAEEIKNLAMQSKQGVVQVRSILSDIQKATAAAVMAAEQSGKAIEEGARRAGESSVAIEGLAENVAAAAQSAMQIVASSQQQLVGMDQISEAMTSIDQASAQNAAGARQMEAEVSHLQELAVAMRAMVESTRADDVRRAPARPAAAPLSATD